MVTKTHKAKYARRSAFNFPTEQYSAHVFWELFRASNLSASSALCSRARQKKVKGLVLFNYSVDVREEA